MSKLFEVINTKNFDLMMRQVDNFIELAKAFDIDTHMVNASTEENLLMPGIYVGSSSGCPPDHPLFILLIFKYPQGDLFEGVPIRVHLI